ncbi:unnamed protein product [Caenorhabditis angaria]|uniref:Uncharacterized protein n=1 Tax=Caenorhabditis angaria TaxID=860376 RepID=A0A9P1J6D2_9PELO|nr:unnamed protein product [Caenorhabditis angaria]
MLNFYNILILAFCGFGMADIFGPISDHFVNHLNKKPKRNDNLIRQIKATGETGSFGGKILAEEKINHTPIIFIHGNSDSALKHGDNIFQGGWNGLLEYFLARDYSLSELYGITYGDRNIMSSFNRKFDCETLMMHRRFIESVLQYTKSEKVNIIAHSMGVSIARKVIQGGIFEFNDEKCDLGANIANSIETFIALAGANYGMCPCEAAISFAACGTKTGFFPGECPSSTCSSQEVSEEMNKCATVKYSQFLTSLNENQDNKKDAMFVASFWSDDDEVLGKGNMVWGKHTSLVPNSDIKKIYRGLKHLEMKTLTAADQYNLIRRADAIEKELEANTI